MGLIACNMGIKVGVYMLSGFADDCVRCYSIVCEHWLCYMNNISYCFLISPKYAIGINRCISFEYIWYKNAMLLLTLSFVRQFNYLYAMHRNVYFQIFFLFVV